MATFEILQEVTDWEFPNHIYCVNKMTGKIHGYHHDRQKFDGHPEIFNKPKMFYKTHRKFKKIGEITNLLHFVTFFE